MSDHDFCECAVCVGGIEAFDAKVERDMADGGISIVGVAPSAETPTFTYTVGFFQTENPEIIIFGLSPPIAATLLNDLADKIKSGVIAPRDWLVDDTLASMPLTFRAVDFERASEFITVARAKAREKTGAEPACLMIVWPDAEGRFPWDSGFDERFRGIQPDIWRSVS